MGGVKRSGTEQVGMPREGFPSSLKLISHGGPFENHTKSVEIKTLDLAAGGVAWEFKFKLS